MTLDNTINWYQDGGKMIALARRHDTRHNNIQHNGTHINGSA
jgi:hypothetical protein